MKRLTPPNISAAQAVETCATGITDAERAAILRQAAATIEAAEREYQALGPLGELYRIAPTAAVTPNLNTALMGTIYKSHFARAGSPSRPLYELIRMAPEFGICPLCGQRNVGSIDHYLPQSHHPKLALVPINLIPACADCNKAKLAHTPTTAEEQSLHPYFDDLGNERWLIAEIQHSSPPGISFTIRPASNWSPALAARVEHHFKMMGLAELYVGQAASEVADISYALIEVGDAGGRAAVQEHLAREFRSRLARYSNSWQTALYDALASSEWFCTVGYRQIRIG